MRRAAAAGLAVVWLLVSGCGISGLNQVTPAPSPSHSSSHAAPHRKHHQQHRRHHHARQGHRRPLLAVHDPRQLTLEGGSPAAGSCHASDSGMLPDRHCTPGAIDPAVSQSDLSSTICMTGYTTTVRPSTSQTTPFKYGTEYPAYSISQGTASELDHLVPLELGGANDSANLWPETGSIPNQKDSVERALNDAVCSGQVSLAAAQLAIAVNWETAEARLGI